MRRDVWSALSPCRAGLGPCWAMGTLPWLGVRGSKVTQLFRRAAWNSKDMARAGITECCQHQLGSLLNLCGMVH